MHNSHTCGGQVTSKNLAGNGNFLQTNSDKKKRYKQKGKRHVRSRKMSVKRQYFSRNRIQLLSETQLESILQERRAEDAVAV